MPVRRKFAPVRRIRASPPEHHGAHLASGLDRGYYGLDDGEVVDRHFTRHPQREESCGETVAGADGVENRPLVDRHGPRAGHGDDRGVGGALVRTSLPATTRGQRRGLRLHPSDDAGRRGRRASDVCRRLHGPFRADPDGQPVRDQVDEHAEAGACSRHVERRTARVAVTVPSAATTRSTSASPTTDITQDRCVEGLERATGDLDVDARQVRSVLRK
jgi:hypothetical protein